MDSDQKETHLINLFKRRSLGEEQAVGSNKEETPFINYSKIKLEHRRLMVVTRKNPRTQQTKY